ncbi:MAG: hypothetical protein M3Y21_08180, partial [Candidatus Eremiobacteraeota bacterium]|nr:hypothetical protein [Candidatus Eremiobacteraeota bacterium]
MAIAAKILDWKHVLTQGIIAGVVGGILIDLFIYLTGLLPNHQPLSGMYLFVASSAIGKAA